MVKFQQRDILQTGILAKMCLNFITTEMLEKLGKTFNLFDKDQDGRINLRNFEKVVEEIQKKLGKGEEIDVKTVFMKMATT